MEKGEEHEHSFLGYFPDLSGYPKMDISWNRTRFLNSSLGNLGKYFLASFPIMHLFFPQNGLAQSTNGRSPLQALNFLLQLAYLQDQFYAYPYTFLSTVAEYPAFLKMGIQEKAQIVFLQNAILALNGTPSPASAQPVYNFAAVTTTDKIGSFPDFATYYPTFLAVAQFIEDTVNRAYLGQLQYLTGNKTLLNQVSGLNSIHARHSSFIRQVRGNMAVGISQGTNPAVPLKPWVTEDSIFASGNAFFNSSKLSLQVSSQAYSGEAVYVQAQINLVGINGNTAITQDIVSESFDEPLSTAIAAGLINSFLPIV